MMKKELDFKVKEMVLADLGRSAKALVEKFQGVECTTENKEWAFDYLANQLIELTEMYERVYNDSDVAEVVEVPAELVDSAEVVEVSAELVDSAEVAEVGCRNCEGTGEIYNGDYYMVCSCKKKRGENSES
jgi:hypothetical protein